MTLDRKIQCSYVLPSGGDCQRYMEDGQGGEWFSDGKKYFCGVCARSLMEKNKRAALRPVDTGLLTVRRQIDPNRPDVVPGDDPNHARVVLSAKTYD